jgi:hypothetical protein
MIYSHADISLKDVRVDGGWEPRDLHYLLFQTVCFYKYSTEKALEAMSILSNEQINVIKQQMDKGGKQ